MPFDKWNKTHHRFLLIPVLFETYIRIVFQLVSNLTELSESPMSPHQEIVGMRTTEPCTCTIRSTSPCTFHTTSPHFIMMTSWNGNIFRVTGHLCGEFTGRLNKRLSKQSWGEWYETQSYLLWRHCNDEKQRCMTAYKDVVSRAGKCGHVLFHIIVHNDEILCDKRNQDRKGGINWRWTQIQEASQGTHGIIFKPMSQRRLNVMMML